VDRGRLDREIDGVCTGHVGRGQPQEAGESKREPSDDAAGTGVLQT
jgi:hypothetical protein